MVATATPPFPFVAAAAVVVPPTVVTMAPAAATFATLSVSVPLFVLSLGPPCLSHFVADGLHLDRILPHFREGGLLLPLYREQRVVLKALPLLVSRRRRVLCVGRGELRNSLAHALRSTS